MSGRTDTASKATRSSYQDMKQRCLNPNSKQYANYGGRGIGISEKWMVGFGEFFKDMGNKPEGMTLDRVDNSKGYCKENCRWANAIEQRRNQRRCIPISFNGETKLIVDWAKDLGISDLTLSYRLNKGGWSIQRALSTPVLSRNECAKIGRRARDLNPNAAMDAETP